MDKIKNNFSSVHDKYLLLKGKMFMEKKKVNYFQRIVQERKEMNFNI